MNKDLEIEVLDSIIGSGKSAHSVEKGGLCVDAYKHVTLYTITNIHNKYHQDNKRFFDRESADNAWFKVADKHNWVYEGCDKSYPDYSISGFRNHNTDIVSGDRWLIDGVDQSYTNKHLEYDTQSVYIMVNELGLVKVGISKNPEQRKGMLARVSGVPVSLYSTYRIRLPMTASVVEARIHKKLDSCRTVGEWFDESVEFVKDAVESVVGLDC